MKILKTDLYGVTKIELESFCDHRGNYTETYNEDAYNASGINVKFIQDDISFSKKNVLRGIHGDEETYKLVSCLHGSFVLIVVNNDKESNEYKKWITFNLSGDDDFQVLIPPKFGNGHFVTSENAIFHYKQNTYYNPKGQFTIMWDDPEYNFVWPNKNPILSKRDEIGKFET
jgi:dTDP-4-dehydrorhamnose 3,5-epimerase